MKVMYFQYKTVFVRNLNHECFLSGAIDTLGQAHTVSRQDFRGLAMLKEDVLVRTSRLDVT